jgi:hypothetical protein
VETIACDGVPEVSWFRHTVVELLAVLEIRNNVLYSDLTQPAVTTRHALSLLVLIRNGVSMMLALLPALLLAAARLCNVATVKGLVVMVVMIN